MEAPGRPTPAHGFSAEDDVGRALARRAATCIASGLPSLKIWPRRSDGGRPDLVGADEDEKIVKIDRILFPKSRFNPR